MPRPTEAFMEAVYAVTELVPRGQVATYGQIATYVVSPRHARAVGAALRELGPGRAVPWHRIINAGGRISHRGDVARPVEQARRLEAEGIPFDSGGRVNLALFGWRGPPDGWIPPFPYPFPIGGRPPRRGDDED